jgi:hypothetical protein
MGPGLSLVGPTVRMRSRNDAQMGLRYKLDKGAEGACAWKNLRLFVRFYFYFCVSMTRSLFPQLMRISVACGGADQQHVGRGPS